MLAGMALVGAAGCSLIIPDVSHQPVVHNPFPQLSRVAVAPFFNQSDEPTVDGRKFALAYFAELQAVPGFEVVPLGVVEEAIIEQPGRSVAARPKRGGWRSILGVDAVVIGSVTDYTPYYPPRCGLRVEWYAANPGFHEIPPGYGLPWGTPEEEYIPAPLVFEAEMALAKAQLATQTPACDVPPTAAVRPAATAARNECAEVAACAAAGDACRTAPGSWHGRQPATTRSVAVHRRAECRKRSARRAMSPPSYEEEARRRERRQRCEPVPAMPVQSDSAAAADTTGAIGAARRVAARLARRARLHSAAAEPGASALRAATMVRL